VLEVLDSIELEMLHEELTAARLLLFALYFALFLTFALILRRIRPVAARSVWAWLGRAAVFTGLYLLGTASIAGLFGGSDDGGRIARLMQQGWMILALAHLFNEALRVFYWDRVFRLKNGVPPPSVLVTAVGAMIYLVAAYAVLTLIFQQNVTGLLVSSTIVAGIIGLALQSTLSDIIGGVALAIDRPLDIGEWVELEDGTLGKVVQMNWRACHIESLSASIYILPNSTLANAKVHNHSRPDAVYAAPASFRVAATVPPDTVMRVLLQAALDAPMALSEPKPYVRIVEAGDTYRYRVKIFCPSFNDHWEVLTQLYQQAWRQCARHGIVLMSETNGTVLRDGRDSEPRWPSAELIFADLPIFTALDADERRLLYGRAGFRTFGEGVPIVRAGESGTSMFVVAYGMVGVSIGTPGNPDHVELARLGSGEYFGEMSLLADKPRSADVTALTECQVLEIDRATMQALFDRNPDLMDQIATTVAERSARMANATGAADASPNSLAAALVASMRRLFT
jgi:small-conductance mechanosensitive channel/CRP-like cAMP-binding protein